jgi:hypothetical protein
MDWGRAKKSGVITAMLVTVLPLLYFLPATRGQLFIAPDDGVIQNIPFRVAIANQLHAGFLPLWNPSLFSGMPLLGAAQAGLLFPLNGFYLVTNPRAATNLMMLSAYLLAALGAYLCARRSGSSVAGAGLTSLVWQASAFLVAQAGHTNIVHTAAVLPWLIWAIDGYGENGDRRRGVALALIVALQCFAGHQQTFAYALLVAAVYAIVLWRSSGRRQYLWSLALVVAGLALAAVQIFPTLELLRHSLRSEATYDFFSSFSMPRRFVLAFLAPYLLGGGDGALFRAPYVGPSFYAEYVGYVGLGSLVLAVIACGFKRDARTIFWASVVPLGILLALGRYAPFDFYKLIYAVPVLNLFRVPARHLMEVQFALALLAGRGLTALQAAPDRKKILRWVAVAGALLFVSICLTVSLGRPADFRLARNAPVTILRAPELFLPPVLALLSIGALWLAAVQRGTATTFLLLATLYLDLNLWGQFSGWRVSSPTATSELWQEPAAFRFLRERQGPEAPAPYRIFTQDHFFDPNQPVSYAAPIEAWLVTLQPDIAMMWGWNNAAGYEGFGLARYSQLAGDMKVWGDLTDPERTLRGESRELDLLNVRYFLARSPSAPRKKLDRTTDGTVTARQVYGGQKFVKDPFGLPDMIAGDRLAFDVPPTETRRFALTSVLAWSAAAPDGAIVATVKLRTNDSRTFEFALRAGEHTSEWAHDRADIRPQIRHKRAPVATSYVVADAEPKFEAHDYVASFELPAAAEIIGGEITIMALQDAPSLSVNIGRISLINSEHVLPIRKEWLTLDSSKTQSALPVAETQSRWQHLADIGPVAVFENNRALPRAWLVFGERIASDEQQLQIIRTGKVAGNTKWKPLSEALVEKSTKATFPQEPPKPGKVEITRLEPNRVSTTVDASAPGLLVLADNHYPGWRAEVDGQRTTIHRVNFNQRAVAVPAGRHVVNFVYAPRSILFGLFISVFTLVLLLCWMKLQPRQSRQ